MLNNTVDYLRFLFIGDLMGQPGMFMFQRWAPKIKEQYKIDSIIVNGENATKNGKGISSKIVKALRHNGADIITSGNHIWQNKEIYNYLNENNDLLRPANFPSECPGPGHTIFYVKDIPIGVINVQGRSFMRENLSCPFRTVESILTYQKLKTKIIFVDFHAEATAEKHALAFFLDGKISGIFGTHTHVQTADEKILPNGTAFITDLGFCGALYSIIGMEKEGIVKKFLTQMPVTFKIEKKPPFILNGVIVDVDIQSGKTIKIERINIIDNEEQQFSD